MEDPAAAVEAIVAGLIAAGIDATDDNRNLNPPCVYVAAPIVQWDRLDGYTMQIDLFAAVPNMGRGDALTALLGPDGIVPATRAVWGTDAGYPVDLLVPDQTDPLPAYRLPIHVSVSAT
jgi:hypothetical protein